jgi:beta-galactosidase GanA
MAGEHMTDNYLNSLIGANYMMTDLHINSDFICEKEVLKGSLSKYKVLILPCTYIISEECAEKIAEFVAGGGHVIADYILAEKRPGGLCYTELPGAGLDKVFGIEREDVLFMAHPTMVKENTFGITLNTFIEQVNLMGAKSVDGEYMSGYPMVLENSYGKGTATYIATQYFAKYSSEPSVATRERIASILSKRGVAPYASFETEDKKDNSAQITSAKYDSNGNIKIVTVTNSDYYPISDTMIIDDGNYKLVEENENIKISHIDGKCAISYKLDALQSFAIYVEK